jgi:hypothetical protein
LNGIAGWTEAEKPIVLNQPMLIERLFAGKQGVGPVGSFVVASGRG